MRSISICNLGSCFLFWENNYGFIDNLNSNVITKKLQHIFITFENLFVAKNHWTMPIWLTILINNPNLMQHKMYLIIITL